MINADKMTKYSKKLTLNWKRKKGKKKKKYEFCDMKLLNSTDK